MSKSQRRRELCKYAQKGICKNSSKCAFSHDLSAFKCKYYFSMGFCENGTQCPFDHESFDSSAQLHLFIQDNFDFLAELQRKNGKTLLGSYFDDFQAQRQQQQDQEEQHRKDHELMNQLQPADVDMQVISDEEEQPIQLDRQDRDSLNAQSQMDLQTDIMSQESDDYRDMQVKRVKVDRFDEARWCRAQVLSKRMHKHTGPKREHMDDHTKEQVSQLLTLIMAHPLPRPTHLTQERE